MNTSNDPLRAVSTLLLQASASEAFSGDSLSGPLVLLVFVPAVGLFFLFLLLLLLLLSLLLRPSSSHPQVESVGGTWLVYEWWFTLPHFTPFINKSC